MRGRAGRPIARRLGIVLAGVLAAVLVLEVAARLFLPDVPGRFTRLDEVTGWSHVPGSRGWWTGEYGEFRAWVQINTDGLRDRDRPRDKPPGTARILTLGDSITAAFQVPLEETFQKVLEERLNRPRESPRYDVIKRWRQRLRHRSGAALLSAPRPRVWPRRGRRPPRRSACSAAPDGGPSAPPPPRTTDLTAGPPPGILTG
jgi:hypothetical protein